MSITWRSRNKSVTSAAWLVERLLTFFRYVFRYLVTRLPPHCNFRISQHVITCNGRLWPDYEKSSKRSEHVRSVRTFTERTNFSPYDIYLEPTIQSRLSRLAYSFYSFHSDRRQCSAAIILSFDRDQRAGRAFVLTVLRGQIILFVLRGLLSRTGVLDRSLSLRRRRHRAGTRRYPVNAVHREMLLDGGDRGGRDRASGSSRFVLGHHLAHCNDKSRDPDKEKRSREKKTRWGKSTRRTNVIVAPHCANKQRYTTYDQDH